MINIALIGCGRIGQMHAANLQAHRRARLHSVFDAHLASAERAAQLQGTSVAASAEAIFADASVDAVLIASATETHVDYIEQAVAANKAILCEKPIDLSLERVNRCAANIAGSSVPIMLGFNRRFDPGHRAARQALLDGEIGALRQVIITSRDPAMAPPEYIAESGGLFRDMTIHDFDLARFMLGSEPVEIFATGARLVEPELMHKLDDYDSAMVIMRAADGSICHINNSRSAVYGYDQRVELLGASGMLQSANRKSHELLKFGERATEVAQPYQFFFIERYQEAYMAELDAFIDCVEQGTEPEVGFDDGRRALVLAEAAYRSLASGKMVPVEEEGA